MTHYGRKLSQNIIASATSAVIGGAITIVSYPVYLHFLGYAEYGLWMVMSTFVTLSQLGSLGIAPAVSKLIAEEFGRNNRNGAQRYVELAISSVTALGLTLIMLLFLVRRLVWRQLDLSPETAQVLNTLLPLMLIISFYAFLTDVFGAVLTGLGRADLTSAIQTASQAIAFGISVALLRLHQGVIALAVGTLISLILVHILTTFATRHVGLLILKPAMHLDWARGRILLRLSSTVFATSLAAALFVPLNKLLLSKYAGLAAVPVYEIAFASSMRLRGLFEIALRPIMPALSYSISSERKDLKSELDQVNQKARRLLLFAGMIFGAIFLFASPLLRVWLRRSLDPSLSGALRLMLVGAFLSLLGVPAYHALLGLGKASALFWCHVVQSATNIAAVLFAVLLGYPLSLTTLLAASGAAMAVSTCFLITRYASTIRSLESKADTCRSNEYESVSS
jgi:O-antigen/teichoic acid export membrane protein